MDVERQSLRILYELYTDGVMTPVDCTPFDDETVAAYIDIELSGGAAAAAYPAFKAHLESCAACSQEYAELKTLLQLEQDGALEALPFAPVFDFSFLGREAQAQPTQESTERAWHLDAMGRLVIRFTEALLQTLRPPSQPLGYAPQRSASTDTLYSFALEQTVEDLNVVIAVREAQRASPFCTIVVEVEIPSRGGWPNLAATTIVLRR